MSSVDKIYGNYDVENEEQDKKVLDELGKKYYIEISAILRRCVDNPDCRLLLYEIFKSCRLFDTTVPEEEKAVHAEGRRLPGVLLKAKLEELSPTLFFEIFTEGVRYEEAFFSELARVPDRQE